MHTCMHIYVCACMYIYVCVYLRIDEGRKKERKKRERERESIKDNTKGEDEEEKRAGDPPVHDSYIYHRPSHPVL